MLIDIRVLMDREKITNHITKLLRTHEPIKARELATRLSLNFDNRVDRSDMNSILDSLKSKGLINQDSDYQWRLSRPSPEHSEHPEPAPSAEPDIKFTAEQEAIINLDSGVANKDGFSFESLEAVRKKLLDLSARNTLLNYKHPAARSIRIIDELPDQVYDELQNEKALTFIPVPEPKEKELIAAGYFIVDPDTGNKIVNERPNAEQWAKQIGLVTKYELPDKTTSELGNEYHQDRNLQTLMYAPALEAKLRGLRGRSETAIEESGSNILYLAIGFLEWFESPDSIVKRSAPLFSIPVVLERFKSSGEGLYRYRITLKEDGVLTNITLREKLANDFGLVLPAIEEEVSPEVYFEQIQQTIIRQQPNWKLRRQATLVLLNYTKQAMYQDLDPNNWPGNASIAAHPIIAEFFRSKGEGNESGDLGYAEERSIDDVEDIHEKFPLVFDADSSQHSAIIDAVNGENLVIEGPPGSGKSQTIANIIAASIAKGKRVLFVAEKMAALNVVKEKLDRVGLGDFCLELHSHKTNKQKILNDLSVRLNKQDSYRRPKEIEADIEHFESLKLKLHDYSKLINSEWKQTSLTLHEIFNKATRYREQLHIDPDILKINGLSGDNLTSVKQKELLEQTDILQRIYKQVSAQSEGGEIAHHYWYGVENTELMGFQASALCECLDEWTAALQELAGYWDRVSDVFAMEGTDDIELSTIWNTSIAISKLPELIGGELFNEIESISEQLIDFKEMLANYKSVHHRHDKLSLHLKASSISDPATLITLREAEITLENLGLKQSTTLTDISTYLSNIKRCEEQIASLESNFKNIRDSIPNGLQECFVVSQNGLKEFKTLTSLISNLPSELWRFRDDVYDDPDLDIHLEAMAKELTVLTPLHKKLHEHISLQNLPELEELKRWQNIFDNTGLFKWFYSDWRKSKKEFFSLSVVSKPKLSVLISLLPEIINYSEGIHKLDSLHETNGVLANDFQGIDTPIDRILVLRNWYKSVRTEYGIGFGDRVTIGNSLLKLDRNLVAGINGYAAHDVVKIVDTIASDITDFIPIFKSFKPFEKKTISLANIIQPLAGEISEVLQFLRNIIKSEEIDLLEIRDISLSLAEQQQNIAAWEEMPITKQLVGTALPLTIGVGSFSKQLFDIGENTYDAINVLVSSPTLFQSMMRKPTEQNYNNIKQCLIDLQRHELLINDLSQKFSTIGSVKMSEWEESSRGIINKLITRNQSALDNPILLETWLEYIRFRTKTSIHGLDNIIRQLEENLISSEDLNDIVQLVIYHQLACEVMIEHQSLALFSGTEHTAYREKFQEYDRKLMVLQRELVGYKASQTISPRGISAGKIGDYTEMGLIRHNLGLKKPRVAMRSLIKRSSKSMQSLKPCFMMSPMSVAQYLIPGKFNFDLVVMDEASQIRPEEALGAIARGDNLVVVGDPKQLPPTTFFQKIVSNDDEDDVVALEESESILDAVIPIFKNRRLRWHYRSRHESLIAFSNYRFYESNLILFPSPLKESDEFGIRFNRVKKGRFVNRRNVDEAREIVLSASKQLIENPEESVGIVAMNAEQADEIERQLEQKVMDDPLLKKAYQDNQGLDYPLFIKNLENVQGDERDIIIISMTYGPEILGAASMHQRFGPINSDVGWRRLNVLVTRSRKRMLIFSSMDSGHISTSENSQRGVVALKAFLEYCEKGSLQHYSHTGKAADSDFEIAVMNALAEYGYECEPQLGVTGYFLDLAVKDPGMPGRFLMGIECDGASYHSAKSTRDRDRLRQDILEDLGWKIRRIWSTDWFKNPDAQLEPILQELARLKTVVHEVVDDEIENTKSTVSLVDEVTDEDDLDRSSLNQNNVEMSLEDRLTNFNLMVIRNKMPNVDESSQLLRPVMMEALLKFIPSSKAEFLETIPAFLREGTDSNQASEYLDDVLELIADYS